MQSETRINILAVKNLKQILMENSSLLHNQPLSKKYLQNLRSFRAKRENPLKTCLWEQNYNLKAIMRRDHKSHIGSPCRSVFTFILMFIHIYSADKSYVTHEPSFEKYVVFWPLFWIDVFKEMRPFIIQNPIQTDLLWIVNIPKQNLQISFKIAF